MEINDVTGLAKPVTKFLEMVQGAIGTWYRPRAVRREADAEAYATVVRACAEVKASEIQVLGDVRVQELAQRARNRLVAQEMKRQENIDAIVEEALGLLPEAAKEDPVDPGWASRFFHECQDISHEELRAVWAKLLANEVAEPGACSRRTLSILRDLSAGEARHLRLLGSYTLLVNKARKAFVPFWRAGLGGGFDAYPFTLGLVLELDQADLVRYRSFHTVLIEDGTSFSYGGQVYVARAIKPRASATVKAIEVTGAGYELMRVATPEPDSSFMQNCIDGIKPYGLEIVLAAST